MAAALTTKNLPVTQMNLPSTKKTTAVVLMSGGLDSTLAAKILMEQDVEVKGIFFNTGFCIQAQKKRKGEAKEPDVLEVCEELGIDLEAFDISREFVPIISNPKFGWGKNINPCIDCRIFMLRKAKEYAHSIGANFIATGEVIGQRPKSQKKKTQNLIEKESGLEGELLRPLSAKLLPPTRAEKEGIVKRELLQDISGRSRKKQIVLAEKLRIGKTAAVGGGCCFLTDKTYANRFKDLIQDRFLLANIEKTEPIGQEDVILLGCGRHIKIRPGLKIIVGRNHGENTLLEHMRKDKLLLFTGEDIPGPTSLLQAITSFDRNSPDDKVPKNLQSQNLWPLDIPKEEEYQNILCNLNEFIVKNSLPFDSFDLLIAASIHARYADTKPNVSTLLRFVLFDANVKETSSFSLQVKPWQQEECLRARMITATQKSANFT